MKYQTERYVIYNEDELPSGMNTRNVDENIQVAQSQCDEFLRDNPDEDSVVVYVCKLIPVLRVTAKRQNAYKEEQL